MSTETLDNFAPGLTLEVRDEAWLITHVTRSTDGYRLKVRGRSDYVRDQPATFFTALDEITVLDPADVDVVADDSPNYRRTRLWLESAMRQTPVPLYQEELSVATQMLADPLNYQLSAVRKALSPENLRPRVLIADAVGLGKTLEMGMILAELIRRGRGERILVVTPRHIMEQFQQEMWSRFAIPLVRLDSAGIQQVRQKLPASRNPFTYFPRVIVSMDTLKSPKYRAQLEKVRWDAVVIDEVHNATNVGTQNNELARTLAPTTEALILASATPHNGNSESFKEILRLLDPTSVRPDGTIDDDAAQRLIIRRHRNSEEVASFVGEKWAPRAEPRNIPVDASDEEDAVARELNDTWLAQGKANPSGNPLFPWTLIKAFLSSPAALGESVANRLKLIGGADTPERRTLEHLAKLNDEITPYDSNKYNALVNYLTEIGVKKGSPTRVVIFSERVATLHWLKENLSKNLKLPAGAVEVMHGGLPDEKQMQLVDDFKRTDSPLRILVTGDVASEGVNLHTLCHHMVHYDIPWSLIRIQQRNGRIDRYGQRHNPQITTLLLEPSDSEGIGEIKVLTRLMEREHEANKLLGDASSLMGKHSAALEEDAIRDVLRGARDFEDTVADPQDLVDGSADGLDEIDSLLAMISAAKAETDEDTQQPDAVAAASGGLYEKEIDYLTDALSEGFHSVAESSPKRGGVGFTKHDNDIAELEPPKDLQARLKFLPQDYLADRKVLEKVTLATSFARGQERLDAARTGGDGSTWPTAHFLGPLHPVTEWAADRALSTMSRREIPAATGDVPAPTVLILATLSNRRGQVVSRTFVTATNRFDAQVLEDPVRWLHEIGLGEKAVNPGDAEAPADSEELINDTLAAADGAIRPMMIAAGNHAQERIAGWRERAEDWEAGRTGVTATAGVKHTARLLDEQRNLTYSLEPDRELLRPLAIIQPAHHTPEV
ncbi:DEAD/DEAH box helicase [Corynebacterium guangdongense]|uniref:ERCC4-related helicase n=1 Tax=Corynebacterium guangdongense TaxID=1783348 RepID=A0ABU1ZWR9_9CORY|nr:DEAD/DEAH box helicase [Corynebacterium guangdongense]MDR7328677.1 ERCC4-related helicase [Corynebacterium guangdongense]